MEITAEWLKLFDNLNESQKRWLAATKSLELGYGSVTKVSNLTGLSRTTITLGVSEIESSDELVPSDRIRSIGGGRKKISSNDKRIVAALEKILDETSAGDPMTALRWT